MDILHRSWLTARYWLIPKTDIQFSKAWIPEDIIILKLHQEQLVLSFLGDLASRSAP